MNDLISEALTLRGSYPALAAVAADSAAGALRLTFLNVATELKFSALLPIGKYPSQGSGFMRFTEGLQLERIYVALFWRVVFLHAGGREFDSVPAEPYTTYEVLPSSALS